MAQYNSNEKKNPKLWNVNSFTGGMHAYSSLVFIYASAPRVKMANMSLQRGVLYQFCGKRQAQNINFYTPKVTHTLLEKYTVSKE